MTIKLNDFIQIAPDKRYSDLSTPDKVKLMDQMLSGQNGQKGLNVRFYLSHAGRRINNRVYSTWGQRAGIDKLTKPYAKPILLDHEAKADNIIGRFSGGVYEDLSDIAVQRFGRIQDFMELQTAMESKDWEKYSAMLHKSRVLLDSKWQGMGRMHVSANITDEDAIEKFLDGRYLTFSGGFNTDAMVCSECYQNWMTGDFCDHSPGSIVNKKPVVLLCGSYEPNEGSVVTHPADDLGVVTGMDSAPIFLRDSGAFKSDPTTIYLTDSIYSTEELVTKQEDATQAPKPTEVPAQIDLATITPDMLKDEATLASLVDQLSGDTLTEQNMLVRLHDSLHGWDWELKYDSEGTLARMPKDIFKLHGKLHGLSVEKSFRDSLTNGPLDMYSETGEETGEFQYKVKESKDSRELVAEMVADAIKTLKEQLVGFVGSPVAELEKPVEATDAQLPEQVEVSEEVAAPAIETAPVTDAVVEDLKQDYAEALKISESTRGQLTQVLDKIAVLHGKDFENIELADKVNVMYEWFMGLEEAPKAATVLKPVENPSVMSSDSKEQNALDKLGPRERRVVERYKKLLDERGARTAEAFLVSERPYLPSKFHPKNYFTVGD